MKNVIMQEVTTAGRVSVRDGGEGVAAADRYQVTVYESARRSVMRTRYFRTEAQALGHAQAWLERTGGVAVTQVA